MWHHSSIDRPLWLATFPPDMRNLIAAIRVLQQSKIWIALRKFADTINSLRFARPPRPGQRPESENRLFFFVFLWFFCQKLDFRSPETQAVIPTKRELVKPLPDRFRDENVQKTYQKLKVFWQKPYIFFFKKTSPGTLSKWKILKFRIYWCYGYLCTTKFDRFGGENV